MNQALDTILPRKSSFYTLFLKKEVVIKKFYCIHSDGLLTSKIRTKNLFKFDTLVFEFLHLPDRAHTVDID